jgi:hypothetical protein
MMEDRDIAERPTNTVKHLRVEPCEPVVSNYWYQSEPIKELSGAQRNRESPLAASNLLAKVTWQRD